jgi:hypothetical protein
MDPRFHGDDNGETLFKSKQLGLIHNGCSVSNSRPSLENVILAEAGIHLRPLINLEVVKIGYMANNNRAPF